MGESIAGLGLESIESRSIILSDTGSSIKNFLGIMASAEHVRRILHVSNCFLLDFYLLSSCPGGFLTL